MWPPLASQWTRWTPAPAGNTVKKLDAGSVACDVITTAVALAGHRDASPSERVRRPPTRPTNAATFSGSGTSVEDADGRPDTTMWSPSPGRPRLNGCCAATR